LSRRSSLVLRSRCCVGVCGALAIVMTSACVGGGVAFWAKPSAEEAKALIVTLDPQSAKFSASCMERTKAVGDLASMASSADGPLRADILSALQRTAVSDPDPTVRVSALEAGKSVDEALMGRTFVKVLATDDNFYCRQLAATYLAEVRLPATLADLLRIFRQERDPAIRAGIAKVAAAMPEEKLAGTIIKMALKDPDPSVSLVAKKYAKKP